MNNVFAKTGSVRRLQCLGISLLAPLVFSCGPTEDKEEKSGEKLLVVTTTTQVTDMVRSLAGEQVEIFPLMGPGVDPHLYKPTAKDLAAFGRADLIFYHGLMLEGRMADLFSKASDSPPKTYAITSGIAQDRLLQPEEFEGHSDPHVWFDPEIWRDCVDVVRDALIGAHPEKRQFYLDNAKSLKEEIHAVHEWATARIGELPKDRRRLVTSHDAFNYFGRAFGIEVRAVQGLSTTTEAGLADRARMVDYVKKHGIKAIFVESSVNQSIIREIARETGAKVGGELFSDAMGEPGRMETSADGITYDLGTWGGMLKHNVNAFVDAMK